VKAGIFGLNAARLFGVDVPAKRNETSKDYLSRIKMAYLEMAPCRAIAGVDRCDAYVLPLTVQLPHQVDFDSFGRAHGLLRVFN
jgi:hypothetical protein